MKLEYKTGETIPIELTIDNVVDLTGAIIKFVMRSRSTPSVTLTKPVAITGNVASVRLDSTDTLVSGYYDYEFRMKLGEDTRCLVYDKLILRDTILKEVGIDAEPNTEI